MKLEGAQPESAVEARNARARDPFQPIGVWQLDPVSRLDDRQEIA
jgi:hypothetical protein